MPTPKVHASQAARQAAYRTRQERARRQQLAAKGLPSLPALPCMPGTARWRAAARQAHELLDCVLDEMRDYFDERSEQWQDGWKGDAHRDTMRKLARVLKTLVEDIDL